MVDARQTREHIKTITNAFRLFPIPGIDIPKPEQWPDFLLENPGYVDGRYKMTAVIIAEDRAILEGMSEDYQRLGGTLIRIALSDEELVSIGEGRFWTS